MSGQGGVVTRSQRLGRRSLDRSDDGSDNDNDSDRYPDSDDSGANDSSRFERSTASIYSRDASIYDTSIASSSHCSSKSVRDNHGSSSFASSSCGTPVSPGLSDRSASSPGTPAYRRGAGVKNQSLNSSVKSPSPRSPATPQGRLYPNLNQSCSSSLSTPSPRSRRPHNNSLYPNLTAEKEPSSPRLEKRGTSCPNASHSQNSSHSQRSSNTWVYIIVCIITAAFLFLTVSDTNSNNNIKVHADLTPFQIFMKDVSSLEDHFPRQARRTWKTVKATAKHVLNETDPVYPSIILIGAGAGHSRLASCIARNIAVRFESSSHGGVHPPLQPHVQLTQTTDIETYRHLSAAEQKIRLDRSFQKAFSDTESGGSGSKSILVENLHMLSAEAALLLYKYCDGDNAPYKNVMILLTVNVWSPSSSSAGGDDGDVFDGAFVETYLADIWKRQIDVDKVDALMSRVANNVVVVVPETENIFRRECQTD